MTGMGIGLGRDPGALDAEAIGHEAADRALDLVGARRATSRRCPVILDAFVAASFAGFIGSMLSADAVQRGRSLFAGREGEKVAGEPFVLYDDGRHPEGPASAPFDGEGTATRRTPLVAGRPAGRAFSTTRALPARPGGPPPPTPHVAPTARRPPWGPPTWCSQPGEATLEELVGQAGDGLYVTEVSGLHSGVNPVSGTFSVGATGRLVEGGELGAPVREMTIAGDLVDMLRDVRAVGSSPRWVPFGGSVMAAPVLIGEMAVSGS